MRSLRELLKRIYRSCGQLLLQVERVKIAGEHTCTDQRPIVYCEPSEDIVDRIICA